MGYSCNYLFFQYLFFENSDGFRVFFALAFRCGKGWFLALLLILGRSSAEQREAWNTSLAKAISLMWILAPRLKSRGNFLSLVPTRYLSRWNRERGNGYQILEESVATLERSNEKVKNLCYKEWWLHPSSHAPVREWEIMLWIST